MSRPSAHFLVALVGVSIASLVPQDTAAQARPDLVVEALSIYATMPEASGQRRITTSFRVVNRGSAPAAPSVTKISVAIGPPPTTGRFGEVVGPPPEVLDQPAPDVAPEGPPVVSPPALPDPTERATPALGPGQSAYFARTMTTAEPDLTIAVTADFARQIEEASEGNNASSYRFVTNQGGQVGRWRPVGPSTIIHPNGEHKGVGRVTTIAVDPRSTQIAYVGARWTGVWKTSDGGSSWEPLTDAIPSTNIAAIAVDPSNPDRVYFAGAMGVFGSPDGGHVWTQLTSANLEPLGADGGALIVHPGDPQRLYLSTLDGLRISRDGGRNWTTVLGNDAGVTSLYQDPAFPDHLFAAVVDSRKGAPSSVFGIYETVDGGLTSQSWVKLEGCPEGRLPPIPERTGAWFAKSGVTQWVSIKSGDNHELWRTSSRTCRVGLAPAFLARLFPGLFGPIRSERVWERLSVSQPGAPTPCIGAPQNSRWSFLYADPTDPDILYKAGIGLCRSTDGGRNFNQVLGVHVDHHGFSFHPAAPDLVLLGNDGGFYRSEDRGASFQFRSNGLQVTEMLDLDIGGIPPATVIGGSQDNGLFTSDLSSPVWVSPGGGDVTMVMIDPLHPDTQYNVAQAVHQFARTGNQSGPFDNSGMPEDCIAYSEADGQVFDQAIVTTSNEWHLLATMDGPADRPDCDGALWTGPPWRSLFKPSDGEAFVRVLHDPMNGLFLAGGDQGSVYINFSPDAMVKVWQGTGSVTAIVRNMARDGSYFVALKTAPGSLSGRIFEIHSTAPLRFAGQDITANLPPGLVMTLASNRFEPDLVYAGTNGGGVLRGKRADSGSWSWAPFNNGMPQGAIVTKLRVDQRFGLIHASTYGRGAFLLDTMSNF